LQQRLSLFQIARVKPFGEPSADRSEQLAGLIPLALIVPEPRRAIAARGLGLLSEQRVDLVRAQPDLPILLRWPNASWDGTLPHPRAPCRLKFSMPRSASSKLSALAQSFDHLLESVDVRQVKKQHAM
jgi:hypothetical protein